MKNELRKQIYASLNQRATDDLLQIWQAQDTEEWEPETFEIIAQILQERTGQAPPLPVQAEVDRLLRQAESFLKNKNLPQALNACEQGLALDSERADIYIQRGLIYDESGQMEQALADYRTALGLDPESEDAAGYLQSAEEDLAQAFESSPARQHLDRALGFAWEERSELALQACEQARLSLPPIAIAYNALGLVLEELEQVEPAIEAYLEALRLNPEFHPARKNLRNARLKLEEMQYRRADSAEWDLTGSKAGPTGETGTDADEDEFADVETLAEDAPVPGWTYADEKRFLLRGWPGHRSIPGRSGYDPLDNDFEYAHMQGVVLNMLGRFKFRTHNPFYLALMVFIDLLCFLPLVLAIGVLSEMNFRSVFTLLVIVIPCAAIGLILLVNIVASLVTEKPAEAEERGDVFF